MMHVRSLIYVLWLYGSMTLVSLGGMPFALANRAWAIPVARTWTVVALWGLRWICGVKVVIKGEEYLPKTGPALLAGKHQAMLDTIMPFVLTQQPCMVLKQELLAMPLFGWYAARMRCIALDRGAHAAALKNLLRGARERIQEGRQIVIFPEGTRSAPGAVTEYKPGIAAIYRDLGLPCTPFALNTGLCWPAKGHLMKPGVVTFEFLPPIPPGLSREDFMRELQTRIDTASTALLPSQLQKAAA
jgi:1-acyl-sn-glycerol-3-phosphate acyltransferase